MITTIEEWKRLLPFIQWACDETDSRVVQFREKGDKHWFTWVSEGDRDKLLSNPEKHEYRFKPEPKKIWHVVFQDGGVSRSRYDTEKDAEVAACGYLHAAAIEFTQTSGLDL